MMSASSLSLKFCSMLSLYTKPTLLKIGCLWIGGGISFMITGSTMAVWLKEYGISYTTIGLFSLLHLPYGLRFLWSPLVDHLSIPYFSKKFGQQKAWLLVMQCMCFLSIFVLAFTSPLHYPNLFIIVSFCTTFSAATIDMILLAYQIQLLPLFEWGAGESTSIFCYRVGILLGGACAIALSQYFSWSLLYFFFGICMISGPFITLTLPLSFPQKEIKGYKVSFFEKAVLAPAKIFISHQGWWSVLVFMFLFRLQDNLILNMPTLFYLDLGFSKGEIASCQKVFGMWIFVLGGILGGLILRSYGYMRSLWIGGVFHGFSGFCYIWQAWGGTSLPLLYLTTSLEEISKGMALIAFFSYQLTCCRTEYAVTQLALLTSLCHLNQVAISSLAGFLVDKLGWEIFFMVATLVGFIGVLWIKLLPPLFEVKEKHQFSIRRSDFESNSV
jgi:PAT family beta-lactamase induction signal transducer AmpG